MAIADRLPAVLHGDPRVSGFLGAYLRLAPRPNEMMVMLPRLLYVFALCALLAGCGGLRQVPPAGISAGAIEVVVFNDGFHSGLLVPHCPELAWVDSQEDAIAVWPWLEVGFGADDWINAREGTSFSKTKLALTGSTGVLMLEHYQTLKRPDRDVGVPSQFWHLRFTPQAWSRMVAFLKPWSDTSIVRLRHGDETRFFIFSPMHWTITRNCHDFVFEWLAAGGLPTTWQMGYTSNWFRTKMDAIVQQLNEAHIDVIDVAPESKTSATSQPASME